MLKEKKDIAIFFWESWLSVSPTIINIADTFAEKGHRVFIFMLKINLGLAPETVLNSNVKVIRVSRSLILRALLKAIRQFPGFNNWFNIRYLDRIVLYDAIGGIRKSLKKNSCKSYDCIGIDFAGLYWAVKLLKANSMLYYLSLELLCNDAITNNDYFFKWIKKKEIRYHKNKVQFTLIPDRFRLRILEKENLINLEKKFSILTNSPRQALVTGIEDKLFFNQKFNFPANKKKILMAGMLQDHTMPLTIARAFGNFKNKEINLIFHERANRSMQEVYLQTIKEVGGENLYLSLTPLPYSEIHKIYSSADIGLVFYDTKYGENFTTIIGASGKLSHYLMYGLPVISNDLPGFKDLFEKYNIGFAIDNINELENAVNKIFSNYAFFSENARKCYFAEYDFDSQFDNFYQIFYN